MAASAVIAPGQQSQVHALGDLTAVFLDVTLSGSYTTGGDALDLSPFLKRGGGAGRILFVDSPSKAGSVFEYDIPNKKLKVYSAGAEIAAAAYAAGLTTGTLRLFALGR